MGNKSMAQHNSRKNRSRAFALLEAVIVMGILAAIALITLPNLLAGSHSADLTATTQQILASAREAQSQSINQASNTPWGIHFANATNTRPFYAIFVGNSYATGTVENVYALPSTLSYVSSTLSAGSSVDVIFTPISGIANATTTIGIEATAQPSLISIITISATGLVLAAQPSGLTHPYPSPLVVGNIWVTDGLNGRVEEFNTSGTYLGEIGSFGTSTGQFEFPRGIGFDSNGNVFVSDDGNQRVQKFNSSEAYVLKFGSFGTGNSQFEDPFSLVVDGNNNVWVDDDANNRVQEFDSNGTYLGQIGCATGACVAGAGNGQLHFPINLVIDKSGNIYVTDWGNNRVDEFNASGTYASQFGSLGAANGQLDHPAGIAIDTNGNIYVADSGNSRVEEFSSSGAYISKFGSPGSANGQFNNGPLGLVMDGNNHLWAADGNNNRVQEFDASGTYLGQLGCATGACVGGPGNGQLNGPLMIAIH
jgi:sugar lactone lactonase YvrE/type II secretory pathway pseudopilin PulG